MQVKQFLIRYCKWSKRYLYGGKVVVRQQCSQFVCGTESRWRFGGFNERSDDGGAGGGCGGGGGEDDRVGTDGRYGGFGGPGGCANRDGTVVGPR